jgi:hypothetical protein
MPAFAEFPAEAEIIGRLLAGYTNLEIGLMNCVQVVRLDFDTVLKAMFRARGETVRIDIADAFGRHYYDGLKLGTEFSMAISAMRYCLRIRNQYAHCAWWNDNSGKLAFANLEDITKGNAFLNDLRTLPTHHVDVPILTDQENYFVYVDRFFSAINYEGRVQSGTLKSNAIGIPAHLKRPIMCCPEEIAVSEVTPAVAATVAALQRGLDSD